mmetsp:Transcript_110020/g.173824  ORF Transcript_110020/g.173824 Transcript_110020/m.173824 type:complete len:220 (-) Transcript_110020:35-694(-)
MAMLPILKMLKCNSKPSLLEPYICIFAAFEFDPIVCCAVQKKEGWRRSSFLPNHLKSSAPTWKYPTRKPDATCKASVVLLTRLTAKFQGSIESNSSTLREAKNYNATRRYTACLQRLNTSVNSRNRCRIPTLAVWIIVINGTYNSAFVLQVVTPSKGALFVPTCLRQGWCTQVHPAPSWMCFSQRPKLVRPTLLWTLIMAMKKNNSSIAIFGTESNGGP